MPSRPSPRSCEGICSPPPHSCEHPMSTHSHKAHEQSRTDGQHVTTCTTHGHSCECVCEPHEHTREHTGHSNSVVGTCSTSHTHTHGASPTFAVGEVVCTRHTRVTPQSRHSRSAAALPAMGIAGCVQGTFGGAVAGYRREKRGVSTCPPFPAPLPLPGHSRAQSGKPWKPGLHSWHVVPA